LILTFAIVLQISSPSPAADSEKKQNGDLKTITLPIDSERSPQEAYYDRSIISMSDKTQYIIAYWREGGSFLAEGIDIFSTDKIKGHIELKRVFSGLLGGVVSHCLRFDVNGDHKEDLVILHETGGQILTKGVTVLKKSGGEFEEIFQYHGRDIWVYMISKQLRIMVKEDGVGIIEEFAWNKMKRKIALKRTLQLVQ